MSTELVHTNDVRPARPALDVAALRAIAVEDARRAYETPIQRAAFVAWATMFVLAASFLAAVGVSGVLDAAGAAF